MLRDLTLCPEMRKPFDMLSKGLSVSQSGGNKTPIELFMQGLAAWEDCQNQNLSTFPKITHSSTL
jgi:hypothetical protein